MKSDNLKFLGVSSGRSGSVYIATVMNLIGIPVIHEQHFIASEYIENEPSQWDHPEIGCWTAQAAGQLSKFPDVKIFHQVRDPLKVIASFYKWQQFTTDRNGHIELNDINSMYLNDYFDVYSEPNQLSRITKYWIKSNLEYEQYSCKRWRVEDIDTSLMMEIGEILGMKLDPRKISQVLKQVSKRTNGQKRTPLNQRKLFKELSPELQDSLQDMMVRYGYG